MNRTSEINWRRNNHLPLIHQPYQCIQHLNRMRQWFNKSPDILFAVSTHVYWSNYDSFHVDCHSMSQLTVKSFSELSYRSQSPHACSWRSLACKEYSSHLKFYQNIRLWYYRIRDPVCKLVYWHLPSMVLILDSRIHGQKTVNNDFLGLNSMTVRCTWKYLRSCLVVMLLNSPQGSLGKGCLDHLTPSIVQFLKHLFFYKILV